MKIISSFLFVLFLCYSCTVNTGFYFYDMNGKEIKINNKRSLNSNNISLYFDRDEIKKSFEEVNIIASNQHYYGDFYFDDVFMNSLNKKVSLLDADALIFEKDLSRYSFYNENYIYFTAIKFK